MCSATRSKFVTDFRFYYIIRYVLSSDNRLQRQELAIKISKKIMKSNAQSQVTAAASSHLNEPLTSSLSPKPPNAGDLITSLTDLVHSHGNHKCVRVMPNCPSERLFFPFSCDVCRVDCCGISIRDAFTGTLQGMHRMSAVVGPARTT